MGATRRHVDFRRQLKLRHVTLLDVLDTTRSMRETARRLGISTAAVSKGCIEIETIIGAQLFDRVGGVLVPTHLCARVVTACRRIDAELLALDEDLTHLEESLRGTVSIGFQAPALHTFLPRWCATIKQTHPYLTLKCHYGMRLDLLDDLETNRLDLILIDLLEIEGRARLAHESLCSEFCIVRDGPVDRRFSEVLEHWHLYESRVWLLPVRGMAMRERFDLMLAARGLRAPDKVVEFNSPIGTLDIADATDGLVFAPASMSESPHRTALAPEAALAHGEMIMTLGVVWAHDTRMTPSARFVFETILADRPRSVWEPDLS
ncbi:putative transcriptional regulator [Ameyamaea chiangmaiensis NBRC 103196]|uniref:LysR family transcriptional regulator n=1 Tax=Ameyamaea chiangmaiensis TaxID=442969 RepID=A0A850PBF6_9PROT|nr:LysR family transcriptional regulator [Ameyamaea chiangmaiensis]MBS4075690.1 LysR family transcriptional regulator [Ameyamaea chiangmaiensis]NVN40263.1 LysR family transcriptional regulator [Ameyamaea chiangmaiensis]GBQ70501.1 putative transcriptional regulator [Ameyamaea chiangmaiensis NBRC 103196]